MMRKRHYLQKNNLKVKDLIDNRNAKVTVQYIQDHQLFQKPDNINDHNILHATTQHELEIENVEYLEENSNVVEYIEDPADKDEYEDNFYPNAIYCLLDLYKKKYESIDSKKVTINATHLWRDIAKDMQESFFEFNERQIQRKYAMLREQYFAVQSKKDIEHFDYFEQLHNIYKDHCKESISKGLNGAKISSVSYKDEVFFQPEHLEINEDHEFKNEETANKEHEFIDMVEKELQAMEEVVVIKDKQTPEVQHDRKLGIVQKHFKDVDSLVAKPPQNIKRVRIDTESCEEPIRSKTKINNSFEFNQEMQEPSYAGTKTSEEFSMYHYNQEQERRHREKMSLLEKSIKIQERAFEQQQRLLQELIKRFS